MKLQRTGKRNHGLALIDVLFILVILVILGSVVMSQLSAAKKNSHGPRCGINLKQLALAAKVWAGDNNDRFPMQVSVTNGGAMEAIAAGDALKVFQVMSNELSPPESILCPQDTLHLVAPTNFTTDLTNKVSYFIGADATTANPQSILAGDDDFLFNQSPVHPGLINVTAPTQFGWNTDRHGSAPDQSWFKKVIKIGTGNLAFTDGSVQSCGTADLAGYLSHTGLATNRLVIP